MTKQIKTLLLNPILWLLVIIAISFVVRLYEIDNAVADWHSWRQSATAAVARNFFQKGYTPFYPQGFDMSVTSESGKYNLNAYFFTEFPIYNTLVYWAWLAYGEVNAQVARLVSVFISLGSLVFVYLLAKKYFDTFTGLMSALFFGIIPFSIFYSRVILPEPILVFFSLGMLYFTDRWIRENKRWLYILSFLFIACAFLTKPMAVFYLVPLIATYFEHEKRLFPIPKRYFLLFIPALLPFGLWRWWMSHFPEGVPASTWLLNGNEIRFKPSFWRFLFQERIGKEILTVTGTIMFFFGLLIRPFEKGSYFLHFLVLGGFLFFTIFATGNIQHDYYQTFIVAPLAIFAARGFVLMLRGNSLLIPKLITIPLALLFFVLMIGLGWYEVRGLYQINNDAIVEGGEEADRLLPKDAIVAAPYNVGDTAFLYNINRKGFPLLTGTIEEMMSQFGVTYYLSVTRDSVTNAVMDKYTVIKQTPKYVIVELKPKQ